MPNDCIYHLVTTPGHTSSFLALHPWQQQSPFHPTSPAQTLAAEVGESCSRLGVAPPIPYSGTFPGRGMYQALAGAALGAELTIPDTPSLQARRRQRRALRRAAWAGGAGLVATLAGYAAWRAYHGLPLLGSGRAAEARAVPEARAAA